MVKPISLVDLLERDKKSIVIPELHASTKEQRDTFSQWIVDAIETLIKRQGGFFRAYEVAALRQYEQEVLGRAKPSFSDPVYIQNNPLLKQRRQQSPIIRDMNLTTIIHHFLSLPRVTKFEPDHVRHLRFFYQDGEALGRYVSKYVVAIQALPNGRALVELKEPYLPFFLPENLQFNDDIVIEVS
ncbi:hypothetical protein HYS50_00350 [Candidatus Woesearchaeota archaeon]|nr:hypothetical protein [Candidatus Woesearchaeota archaeon]